MSNAKSDVLVEWEARAMTRRPKYKRKMAILLNNRLSAKKELEKEFRRFPTNPRSNAFQAYKSQHLSVSEVH